MKLILAVTRTGQPDFINLEKIRLKAQASDSSRTAEVGKE